MLIFNIQRVFALRGIANPYKQLVTLGISRPTAWNLLENKVSSINSKHLEKICAYLNCQPNDLYDWRPAKDVQNVETHPLRGLRREGTAASYAEMVRNIPLNKVTEIETLLAGLKDGE